MQSIVWHYTNPFRPHFFIFLSYVPHIQLLTTVLEYNVPVAAITVVLLITTIHHTSCFVPRFHRTTTPMHKSESSLIRKHLEILIISSAEMIL
jgi:hypothetical protein